MSGWRWERLVLLAALTGITGLSAAEAGPPAPAPGSVVSISADELILQFKRPELQAALLEAGLNAPARLLVEHALEALAQRHGVKLHYVQTLGVGSALVAMTPATTKAPVLDALIQDLAADDEVAYVELNARMKHFTPSP